MLHMRGMQRLWKHASIASTLSIIVRSSFILERLIINIRPEPTEIRLKFVLIGCVSPKQLRPFMKSNDLSARAHPTPTHSLIECGEPVSGTRERLNITSLEINRQSTFGLGKKKVVYWMEACVCVCLCESQSILHTYKFMLRLCFGEVCLCNRPHHDDGSRAIVWTHSPEGLFST